MRISYWSSDLCSSDLFGPGLALGEGEAMLNIAHGRYAQAAVQPPSTLRLAPVMFAASSRVRKAASAATCSTVTNCLVGWPASSTSSMTCSRVMCRAFILSGIWFSTSGVQQLPADAIGGDPRIGHLDSDGCGQQIGRAHARTPVTN